MGDWVEPTQLAFVILGASMAALALMILVTAILATGATRMEVYRSSMGRAGGRVASACFIFITYILLLAWLLVLACCIVMTTFYTLRSHPWTRQVHRSSGLARPGRHQ